MTELEKYRKQIDEADNELLDLFFTRMQAVSEIARIKRENALPVEDINRERQLIKDKLTGVCESSSNEYVERFFEFLIGESKRLQRSMFNIYLTGMPYSGKSTLLKQLNMQSKRRCADTDDLIEESAGMSIAKIFERYGENTFRKLETEVLKATASSGSMIVATGGGILTQKENLSIIKNSGYCILCDRKLEKLRETYKKSKGRKRPKIKNEEDLEILYFERFKLYRETADLIINPDDRTALSQICEFMKEKELV